MRDSIIHKLCKVRNCTLTELETFLENPTNCSDSKASLNSNGSENSNATESNNATKSNDTVDDSDDNEVSN